MATCAVLVTSVIVRREFFAPAPEPRRLAEVADWREYAAAGHRSGSSRAKVTIVTFSDFQCPACRRLEQNLRALQARHPERVAVVYRHLPLEKHAFALSAARASECAAAQSRFQGYRDALFARQDSIGVASWTRFAEAAEVPDLGAFEGCMSRQEPVPAVEHDRAAARRLAASVTPTVLINQFRINGALPLAELEQYVLEAERSARSISAAHAPGGQRPIRGFTVFATER